MSDFKSVITNVSVLWGDMDGFGHVNNIIYLKWCETSRIELFRRIWNYEIGNMEEILEKGGVGPILANLNMDYKYPVKYPDEVKIVTYLTHIGNSSMGIGHELFSQTEDKLVAKADSVVVMVNYVSNDKVKIGNNDREKLSQYLME
jgi:acyl-CoA thioester hydrolase